jgi:hypothetical protein
MKRQYTTKLVYTSCPRLVCLILLDYMSEQQMVGVLPPFSAVEPKDQAGKVYVVTILATIYVVLSALVRGFVK